MSKTIFTIKIKRSMLISAMILAMLILAKTTFAQDKGSCISPYATLTVHSDFASADANYTVQKQSWSPNATGTINTYAIINSGISGKVGFDLSHQISNTTNTTCLSNSNKEMKLFLKSVGACNWASGIGASVVDGGNGVSWSNPEFYGLSPNTDYIVQVRTIIPSTGSCLVSEQYLTYYQISDTSCIPSTANAGADGTISSTQNTSGVQLGTTSVVGCTYTWTPTTRLSNSTISNPIANPSVTTTYTLNISNGSSCTASDDVIVTINNGGSTSSCGSCQNANCAIVGPATASTLIAARTAMTTMNSNADNTFNYDPNPDLTGPASFQNFYSISMPKLGTLGSKQLTVGIVMSGITYTPVLYNKTNGACGNTISATRTNAGSVSSGYNPEWDNLPAGDYILAVTVNIPSGKDLQTMKMGWYYFSNPCTPPAANAGVDATIDCSTTTNGVNLGVANVSGCTYAWSPAMGLSNAAIFNPIAKPSATTTYTLTITDAAGCSASDQITVTVSGNSFVASAGVDRTISCTQNQTGAQIGATNTAGIIYLWSPTTGLSDANTSNPFASPTITSTYSLSTTTSGGCVSSDQVVVSVFKTVPTADAGNGGTIGCNQNTNGIVLGQSWNSGTSYSWLPITALDSADQLNPLATPATTTTYTLTATNNASGCTATDEVVVAVSGTNLVANAGVDGTIGCTFNSSGLQIGALNIEGCTYIWSPTTGLNNSTISNPIANPSSTTTYKVTITSAGTSCTSTDGVVVTVSKTPPSVDAGVDTEICGENTISIGGSPSASGGKSPYVYSWNNGLSTVANPTIAITKSTTYTLVITDANGCMGTDATIITVNPKPIADAGTSLTICKGSSYSLGGSPTASNGTGTTYNYEWDDTDYANISTASNPVVSPTANITYTLFISDSKNCSDTTTVEIKIQDCSTLGKKDTLANDTTGISISNKIEIAIDSCIFNYNLPLDSFNITGYSIDAENLILNWVFYQNPNVIHLNTTIPLSSFDQGNNLLSLTIQCTKDKSSRSVNKNTFIAVYNYLVTNIPSFDNSSIRVFPNPVNNTLNIVFPDSTKEGSLVELHSIDSKVLVQDRVRNNLMIIDMSKYPQGVYVLNVLSSEGMMIKKLVKK